LFVLLAPYDWIRETPTNRVAPTRLRFAEDEVFQSGRDIGRQPSAAQFFEWGPMPPYFGRALLHFLRFEFLSQSCHLPSPF
jgi:hypothetical protein